eukprot:TRINITY_DN6207_c0_g1_i1.p3 TRINITY_DN6207_c0_g1~~TRINITY_DN6207_c0_g1_i1.p3  ORF type:complete len:133 (+),score=47.86 TRINITY_DN6207_c0_g1_i1:454-852(+)
MLVDDSHPLAFAKREAEGQEQRQHQTHKQQQQEATEGQRGRKEDSDEEDSEEDAAREGQGEGSSKHRRRSKMWAMEDAMVSALQQMPWKRVDVSFKGTITPWAAHNLIQVKSPWLHSSGAGVISHVIDHMEY